MKPITPFSISAPGFAGLNTSDAPVDLPQRFALVAENCIIDRSGRIASRKGWVKAHSTNTDLGSADIEVIGEVIENGGTATTIAAGNGFLFKLVGSTLTTLTYGGGGAAPTITLNNWKFCQLNGVGIFWQRGFDPLIYDPDISTANFRRLNEKTGTAGTVPQANVAISAYGRIWAADTTTDKNTLVFSDLLSPHIYTGGTSGTLNLIGIWPIGGDEIVALGSHNNFLFIFGRKQILIYQGANTPSTMTLADTIVGLGCIARDTAIAAGEDIFFLSDMGLMSLQRVVQDKSAPFRSVSRNVDEDIKLAITNETVANIKAGFSAVNGFYLLTFPVTQKTFCFDTRNPLPDGSAKTTTWSIVPKCIAETKGRKLYFGVPGYIGEYSGYNDDMATYRMNYYSTWIDFGNPIVTSILKKILLTVVGGSNQIIIFKWAYDFSTSYFSEQSIIPASTSSEYGIAEYDIGEYSGGVGVNTLTAHGTSSGKVLQFGFEVIVSANSLSIQKIDIYTKDGRY